MTMRTVLAMSGLIVAAACQPAPDQISAETGTDAATSATAERQTA